MGTKRIGLARVQALIENLKRDLDMGNTALSGMSQKIVSKTSSYALTAAMSGEVHVLSGGSAVTATLPSLTSGLRYTIIVGDTAEHVIAGGASKIYYSGWFGADGASATIDHHDEVSTLTLNSGGINDRIEIHCDGTNWYVNGVTRFTMDAGA
jgi:hypothetical protein